MCIHPLYGYYSKELTENGKRKIVFNMTDALAIDEDFRVVLPCGKCDECRMKKAKMWSLRCVHEAKYHKDKVFLTLTYDDEHLPRNCGVPTLRYKDVQDFLKRLRKYLGDVKIRYFCSSEYGAKKFRPHYHMILYGWSPPDLRHYKRSYSGLPIYKSKILDSIWENGYVFVGTVTEMSANYVARYTLEKNQDKGEKFYEYREKESVRMSRRPGIGFTWINRYWKNVAERGFILFDNIKHAIPRFYRSFIEKVDLFRYKILQSRLKKRAREFSEKNPDTTPRSIIKSRIWKIKLSRLPRRLFNENRKL